MKTFCFFAALMISFTAYAQSTDTIQWGSKTVVRNVVPDSGGKYGSQYARMLILKDGSWLMGYTISRQRRYDKNVPYSPASTGGLELEISRSMDEGRSWSAIATLPDPGRDLDNAQLIETTDGSVLLSCRSVRWQESYILRVYKSRDKGRSWEKWSVIDSTAGVPGALGHPDKGIYEPHFFYLADGRLAVQYANEKHVVDSPSYSQIISEKISPDEGRTWGPEIWVAYEPGHPASRPGMPVWTRMNNGIYITVYEICGPEKCHVYYKTSPDGAEWPVGLGTAIPDQLGGPFVLGLTDGRLVVTSNNNHFSISDDLGKTWRTVSSPWSQMLWGSLYQAGAGRIISVNSAKRPEGGNNIQTAVGILPPVVGGQHSVVGDRGVSAQAPGERWSVERINQWYDRQPWYCGFNYIPAYAINYTAMWDKTSFDAAAIDKELALAEKTGLNALRCVMQYAVYNDDSAYFIKTFNTFLGICGKHKIKVVPIFFDDCKFGLEDDPKVGKQPDPLPGWYAWGWSPSPGHSLVIDASKHYLLEKYVKAVLTRFRDDDRILLWDLYNEPTNGEMGTASLPLVRSTIRWAREVNPSQPLSMDIWNGNAALNNIILPFCDVVTFHNYGNLSSLTAAIDTLSTLHRPVICTEWLNRYTGSRFQTHLALMKERRVGSMFWGLVNGKTQTNLPWGHRPGDPASPLWQHDIYKGDLTPYDPGEIRMLKEATNK